MGAHDTRALFYPWFDFVRANLSAGRLPLWDPYQFAGYPFLHNPQVGFFYPPAWLPLLLPIRIGVSFYLALHVRLAAAGIIIGGLAIFIALAATGVVLLSVHPNETSGRLWHQIGGYAIDLIELLMGGGLICRLLSQTKPGMVSRQQVVTMFALFDSRLKQPEPI